MSGYPISYSTLDIIWGGKNKVYFLWISQLYMSGGNNSQPAVLGKKLRGCNGSQTKQDSKMSCRYKKRKCLGGMYEQEKSNMSETALLVTLGTEKASRGVASTFEHYNQCVGELERGQRQARRQIRSLENRTSEESLQLISLKKKELRRQHHNSQQTHRSLLWRRKAQPALGTHDWQPMQEASLPVRKNWVRCEGPCKEKAHQALWWFAWGGPSTSIPKRL